MKVGRKKLNPINEMKKIHSYCENKGGKCLEVNFNTINSKYKCICKNNHKFNLSWSNAKYHNGWCKYCSGIFVNPEKEIECIKKYCIKHNGKCLEDKYERTKNIYKCICQNNHTFYLKWSNQLKYGHSNKWCEECKIKAIYDYCEVREGKCLEKKYKGTRHHYKCICKNNHVFYLFWNDARRRNLWCYNCNKNNFEKLTIYILEKLTNHKFIKVRPSWLVNPRTKCKLELDCYCEKLKLAIECQGPQHYKKMSCYKMTDDNLKNQQYRDLIKKKICKSKGIKLIDIQYTKDITKEKLENLIKHKLTCVNMKI